MPVDTDARRNSSYAHREQNQSRTVEHRTTRWNGIARPYGPQEVERLRASVQVEYTLARMGAERLWDLLHDGIYAPAWAR